MIHVITAANRALYGPQLLQMHRLRAKIFVGEMGWNRPVAADGGEYDEGDDDRAIYFLAIDANGEVEAGIRARPTDDWCMAADVFPHFVGPDEESVRNPDVWEMARLFAARNVRGPEGFNRRGEVRLAIIEKAVQCGIRRIIGMSEVYLVGPAMRSGWRLRVCGLPQSYGEGDAVAVEVEASPGAVEELMERLALTESVMLELDASNPMSDIGLKEAEIFVETVRRLTPESRKLVSGISRAIAKIEQNEGVDAAIAAVERVRQLISEPEAIEAAE
jgi:N-acyl-L-homoserine lactone synthetase